MIQEWEGNRPEIHPSVYIHETSDVIGRVTLEKDVSIWPHCVLRGDVDKIVIGEGTNLQDNTIIHTNVNLPAILGKRISVGHSVILHGCSIKDDCIIGMGAILLDEVIIEEKCIIGAGAVVSPGTRIHEGHMALGVPARAVRLLTTEELDRIEWNAREYLTLKDSYMRSARTIVRG